MKGLLPRKPKGLGRLPRYCFIPGMLVLLAETCRSTRTQSHGQLNEVQKLTSFKTISILEPSTGDHAILIHLKEGHSEQHLSRQTPHKQILLVDQTCQSK